MHTRRFITTILIHFPRKVVVFAPCLLFSPASPHFLSPHHTDINSILPVLRRPSPPTAASQIYPQPLTPYANPTHRCDHLFEMTDVSPSNPPSSAAADEQQQDQHPSQLEDHYDTVATRYQSAWFYEDGTDYQSWLLETLLPRLQPLPTHRTVDLGGGTGNFSTALHRRCQLEAPIVCVDPSAGLLEQAKQHPEVETLLADGLGFVKLGSEATEGGGGEEEGNTYRYDRLLLKEVVHHFAQEKLPEFFAGVYRQMLPEGRVVIMTR